MLDKSSIKWRQRPDMTFAVDCNVKDQFKQTNKITTTILTMTLHPHHLQFAYHAILILGTSPIKRRQHPDMMTIAVDWDVKANISLA